MEENNSVETKEAVNDMGNGSQTSIPNGMNSNIMPEVLTNEIYTPAFLRTQIGRLMRVEFLIGTNNLVDRIGVLADVGASYILLRSFENDSLVYCDLYSIKFITISTTSRLLQSLTDSNYMQDGMNNNYLNNGFYHNNYANLNNVLPNVPNSGMSGNRNW